MSESYEENAYDDPRSSAWLERVLSDAGDIGLFLKSPAEAAPSPFLVRCRDAASLAVDIVRLRREHQRIGFVPLPLADYIEDLIKLTGLSPSVSLDRLAGLEPARYRSGAARELVLAQLAKKIGLTLKGALLHVRIGIASRFAPAQLSLLLAHRRSAVPVRKQQEECEGALSHIESQYDALALAELRKEQAGIREAFNEARTPEL